MSAESQHPKDRPIEDEDPVLLTAEPVQGEPERMLTGLIEEFARQGFDADHILKLFDSPFFQATWGLRELLGEEHVRQRVHDTLARCGVLRFRTRHGESDAGRPEHDIPDVLNCAPPSASPDIAPSSTGDDHAASS